MKNDQFSQISKNFNKTHITKTQINQNPFQELP